MAYILSVGAFGNDVRRLQEYLNQELSASLGTDGSYGGKTKEEVIRFRRKFGLPESPTFDDQCFAISEAHADIKPDFDPDPAKKGIDWPKKKPGLSSPSAADMQSKCGVIKFNHSPVSGNPEHITITNGFEASNITTVNIPELKDCVIPLDSGVTKTDGRIRFHKNHTTRLAKLFSEWAAAGLANRILTFDGSFNARLKRGKTKAVPENLSNHAWGTAFDINATWNARGTIPALMGDRGCVREMVAIAHANGFYWGGYFTTKDGMHFEVAAESL
ncbi:peptidoglycan hydrolase-like protein with peptidoglycan-binding domain [Rhizobium sp. BK512]|uniref:M15 family metallopeptidase n=1 Tax=Rhizobium sp. BK512 TaxID=2587010 RepID=UPI00161DE070|nr:M15 family metallopeptidase [Rhizobium sp. BK512]MBB3558829.1 peptidoglycan hydrolase-like protein with peptidoglycan-binding domain [Rhizobium sp. BK512]